MPRCYVRRRITRWLIACTFVVCIAKLAAGQDVSVNGYWRNGTWVPAHMRSHPDGNFGNNWTTKGNQNPYTGEWGTRVTPPGGNSSRFSMRPYSDSLLPGNTSLRSNGYSSVLPGFGSPDAVSQWRTTSPPRFAPAARVNSSGTWTPPAVAPEYDAAEETGAAPKEPAVHLRPLSVKESLDTGVANGQVIENPFFKQPR